MSAREGIGLMECRWEAAIPDVPTSLAVSESHVLIVGAEGTALALDRITGEETGRISIEGGLLHADVSPNGAASVLTGTFGAFIWGMASQEPSQIVEGSWCSVGRWISDERLAVAAGRRVEVFDARGTIMWRSESFPSTVTDLAWLGGRHRIAVASYGGVHVVEPRKGGTSTFMPFTGSLLAISADSRGRWIVSGNQDATLQVFRSDKDTRLEMEGYPSKISRVSFDSSGKLLANDGAPEVSVWDFSGPGPRGRAPILLVSHHTAGTDVVCAFEWQPGADYLAVGWESGRCELYQLSDGVPGKQLSPTSTAWESETPIVCVSWSPSGDALVLASADGAVRELVLDRNSVA